MRLRAIAFWLRTATWFLVRSGRSTAVLSLMVLLSVATLIFLSSLAVGVNDAMVRNSVRLYAGHVTGTGLPPSLSPGALQIAGVDGVVKRFLRPGVLQRGAQAAWITLVSSDPDAERKNTALAQKVVEGRNPRRGEKGVLLSRFMADALGVGPGDEVTFRPDLTSASTALTVSGVYRTGVEQIDRTIAFCPRGAVPLGSEIWSAAVFLKDGVDPLEVVSRYRATLGTTAMFQTWSERMPDLKQLIDLNYVSMTLVTVIVFALVALGVSCAFVIFILKNLREYGILKAMGVTPLETTSLIVIEVTMLNLVSLAAGIALGVVAVSIFRGVGIDLTALTSHNRYFAISGIVYPRLTPYSLWVPPAVAFAFSLAASIWPAVTVVRSNTAEILRNG